MKTFLLDIFPKIKQYSLKLDDITFLTNQHWVAIDNIVNNKAVYIFRSNNELLVSNNGKIEKGRWEYLGNKSLLIDRGNDSYLFKHDFMDENIMALKVDSSEEYAVFVNENKYDGELNSVQRIGDFLNKKYLYPGVTKQINKASSFNLNQYVELKPSDIKSKKNNSIRKDKEFVNFIIIVVCIMLFIIILFKVIENVI